MNPFGALEVVSIDAEDPFERGLIHGKRLQKGIKRMGEIRLELMLRDTDFKSEQEVLDIARVHLPLLQSFDSDLHAELMGIAEGSGASPETIVIINHYTDMRDIRKAPADEGGCSVMFTQGLNGPLLGQTWDVHGSATEHVFVLKLPNQVILSAAGCLGMTGMNSDGVAITINNLSSLDAKVGIVWPALVRKVLKCQNAEQGRDLVMNAPLGSGHHYVIADKKSLYAIETSGTKKKITQSNTHEPHIHTNHCLDAEMRKTHTIRPTSTTFERMAGLERIIAEQPPTTAAQMYEDLGQVSYAPNPNDPRQVATCGAIVMDIARGFALACKGPASEKYFQNTPLRLEL